MSVVAYKLCADHQTDGYTILLYPGHDGDGNVLDTTKMHGSTVNPGQVDIGMVEQDKMDFQSRPDHEKKEASMSRAGLQRYLSAEYVDSLV